MKKKIKKIRFGNDTDLKVIIVNIIDKINELVEYVNGSENNKSNRRV